MTFIPFLKPIRKKIIDPFLFLLNHSEKPISFISPMLSRHITLRDVTE